jgi:hypothetical protein
MRRTYTVSHLKLKFYTKKGNFPAVILVWYIKILSRTAGKYFPAVLDKILLYHTKMTAGKFPFFVVNNHYYPPVPYLIAGNFKMVG